MTEIIAVSAVLTGAIVLAVSGAAMLIAGVVNLVKERAKK